MTANTTGPQRWVHTNRFQQGTPTVPKGSSQTATATNWVWENTLNYAFKVKENHHFNILAGYTSQKISQRLQK
ncbi:MAG: hypothetical protein WDM78_16065 [Puia sp.]